MIWQAAIIALLAASLLPPVNATEPAAARLRVAVVQMVQAPTLAGNRDRIVAGTIDAAHRGARVVVFPEAALLGGADATGSAVDEAVAAIRRTAQAKNVYVIYSGAAAATKRKQDLCWMQVFAPDGRELLRYDKLYVQPHSKMPDVFTIDGVPCNTMICADRWLRGLEEVPIQQGAKVSFELSCNSVVEWVEPFGWYWYVPRAIRNNVWVIFANTGNTVTGVTPYPGGELRHGHSAIIAPDGRIAAAANDDVGTTIIADIEVGAATRAEALARASHPALRAFWAAGVKRQAGGNVAVPAFTPYTSPAIEVTLAAAQVVDDVPGMEAKIRAAHRAHADAIVFPARAVSEQDIPRLQSAARSNGIVVVVGAEHREGARRWNSAFVLGPDGTVLTRCDELSATKPYEQGAEPATMWFRVKGVPAVVTVGRDGLWSELAELAAAAGAQIHVHLDHDRANGGAALVREQVWCNLASFLTFSATVNVVDSMIWDDLRALEERRAPIDSRWAESGAVEVYSQYSANLVAHAKSADELLVVTRRVNATNGYHTRTIARKNPQMDAWYRFGAASLQPK